MSIYRENVLEIVDNWGGYPLQTQFGCDPDFDDLPVAINSGVVEVKCFINNTCPFYKSAYKEDGLVFNRDTYERIQPWLPNDLDYALSVTKGISGMHFTPRWVYRHNYVYQKSADAATTDSSTIFPDLFTNFDTDYVEVSQIRDGSKSGIEGVDMTRYKPEQSWVVAKSIFDTIVTVTDSVECDHQAEWSYIGQKAAGNGIEDSDLKYDYFKDYYKEYDDSWEKVDGKWRIKPANPDTGQSGVLLINKARTQMPVQTRVLSTENTGVHWRLRKRTPLYKGEDFFIRFYKQADDTISNPHDKEPVPFSEEFKHYHPLDITRNEKVVLSPGGAGIPSLMRKINFGISPPPLVGKERPSNDFDFHDQSYYIIEMGEESNTDNYFIIITERANPIFVHFVPATSTAPGGGSVFVSKRFSEPAPISGKQLIHAKWFDMTVRNHLGAIVIQFSGPGIDVDPWVIKRWDWVPDVDPVSNELYLKDKVTSLFVPRGRMTLMGGNIRCGFMFGPLQYVTQYISMIYPPREQFEEKEDMQMAFTYGQPEEIIVDSMPGAFKTNPFFLPSQGKHDILFSSTDIYLQDLGQNVIPVGQNMADQPLFMQDAQYYSNYRETNSGANIDDYVYGGFLYDYTLKDFSDLPAGTSNIIVKKYRYLNDPKTKQQAFDVLIGMMAGDHVFTKKYWNGNSPPDPGFATESLYPYPSNFFNDDEWLIPACKTPILASLRLIAHESRDIRWEDGSTTSSGIYPDPTVGISPYFLDATDHVMSFSDSWSASSFSEMEHTGSLTFYLNRGMPVDNNVTDALLSLQNKTFYVEIWAGYTRPCQGVPSSYSRQNGLFKLFTGLCHGGKIDYQYGKNIMSCKVEDYTAVLKGARFFNSPWFDGQKDINCIREIMQFCGFRDMGKYDPGHLIKLLSDNTTRGSSNVFFHHFDGRLFKMENYALPSGYNRLDQPAFKFNDGDPYMDAVVKIAKRASKVFFFDQHGIAHYENFQDLIEDDYLGRTPIVPLYAFTTNSELYGGQLIFNKLERNYDVQGVINHIKIMSNTPDFYLLIGDNLNWSSMEDPNSEGFIGYLKSNYQQESMLGSKKALKGTINKYSVSFRPKILSKFETYGVPLRANDIVSINGETTRVRKVSHNINAEKNEWWMEVETEKYQVIQASHTIP